MNIQNRFFILFLLLASFSIGPVDALNFNNLSTAQKVEFGTAVAMGAANIADFAAEKKGSEKTKNIVKTVSSVVHISNAAMAIANHKDVRSRGYNFFRLAVHGYTLYKSVCELRAPKKDPVVAPQEPGKVEPKKPVAAWGRKPSNKPSLKTFTTLALSVAEPLIAGAMATGVLKTTTKITRRLNVADWNSQSQTFTSTITGSALASSLLSFTMCSRKVIEQKDTKKRKMWSIAAGISGLCSLGEAYAYSPEGQKRKLEAQASQWRSDHYRKLKIFMDRPVDLQAACTVCMEELGNNDNGVHVRIPTCGHDLHHSCLNQCRQYNPRRCPTCREPLQ